MTWGYRYDGVLRRLAEGMTFHEAAKWHELSRQAVWKLRRASPKYNQAVLEARQQGQEEREYQMWLRHPFRGLRPPTGKGHGGKPRFRYGRR